MRQPLSLSKHHSKVLSRYLIEDGESPYTYNKYLHKKFDIIIQKLSKLVGAYCLFDATNESSIHRTVVKKLGPLVNELASKLGQIKGNTTEQMLSSIFAQINASLQEEEMQYLLLIMYRASKDSLQMSCQSIIKMLHESKETLNAEIEEAHKHSKQEDNEEKAHEYEEEAFEVEDNSNKIKKEKNSNEEFNEEEDTKHRKMAHSAPPADIDKNAESASAWDKAIIEIAQKVFTEIFEKLTKIKMTLRQYFNDYIEEQIIKNEKMEVISVKSFIEGLNKLGVNNMSEDELNSLVAMLAIDDENHNFLKMEDLESIIAEYNEAYNAESKGAPEGEQEYAEGMDEITLVVMYALNQQLIREQSSLRKLLGKFIFKKSLQEQNKVQKDIEVIKIEDFYNALTQVGIQIDIKDLANLQQLLCAGPENIDLLKVRKIDNLIHELTNNEELRKTAQKCYNEIVKQEGENEEAKENELESPDKQDELVEMNEPQYKEDYNVEADDPMTNSY